MVVTVLLVHECPSESAALALTRQVLGELGASTGGAPGSHDGPVELECVVIADDADAQRRRFLGSPSWHVDGVDVFADVDRAPGLTCRVYRDGNGRGRAMPTAQALSAALRNALGPAHRPVGLR